MARALSERLRAAGLRKHERNGNAKVDRAGAEYVIAHRSRMTAAGIGRAIGQPRRRVSRIALGKLWPSLAAEVRTLPPLEFPRVIHGLEVRPVVKFEVSHAVTRDCRVFFFPRTADQEHHSYAEARELAHDIKGRVRITRGSSGRSSARYAEDLAAEAWGAG